MRKILSEIIYCGEAVQERRAYNKNVIEKIKF